MCGYSLYLEGGWSDTRPKLGHVVSLDPDTCLYEVEYGVPAWIPESSPDGVFETDIEEYVALTDCSDEEMEADECHFADEEANLGNGVRASLGGVSESLDTAHVHLNKSMTFTTVWEDPINLDVTKVRSAVKTNTSGSSITGASCSGGTYRFVATGWIRITASDVLLCEATSTWAWRYREHEFRNQLFCDPGAYTWTYYYGNIAKLTPNNWYGWINNTYSTGDCAGLLSWYTIWEPEAYY